MFAAVEEVFNLQLRVAQELKIFEMHAIAAGQNFEEPLFMRAALRTVQ
jgi:hypothetical protein